jgi:hypothetical protein
LVFWDLNHNLGCSPLGIHAYRAPPFPDFKDEKIFGVGQEDEGFPPQYFKSVALPLFQSLSGLDLDQFRQEPAITELDWLFTPSHRLEEHMSIAPLQASTNQKIRFTLPTTRSPGFGSYLCDCGKLIPDPSQAAGVCFRFGYFEIILAT